MKAQDFRNYHLLLDGQAERIFAMTDDVGPSAQDWRNTICFWSAARLHSTSMAHRRQLSVKYHAEESAKRTRSLSCTTKVSWPGDYVAGKLPG